MNDEVNAYHLQEKKEDQVKVSADEKKDVTHRRKNILNVGF
jgi:hypothetical protein